MRRELKTAIHAQVKQQVMDQLLERHDPTLPKALVEQEAQALRAQMAQQFGSQSGAAEPPAEPPALSADLFLEQAERRVALGLIAREIAELHGLSTDAERVKRRIQEFAEPYADREQVINWYYRSPEQLARVELAVLEDQVVETVLQQAQVSDRQRSYADIIAGKALAGQAAGAPDAEQRESG